MRAGQARIGVREMERVDCDIQSRIAQAAIYHDGLNALPDVYTPRLRKDASHIYTYFPIQVADRRGLLRYAQQKGRDFAAQHLRNCADLEIFAEFYRNCPAAREAAQELVLLPTYPGYPVSEIRKNVCVIQEWLSKTNIKGWKIKKDGRSTTTNASITAPDSLDRPTTAIR
jgi:dTDP-4-amino-4,6-dideoxygalactose transaminase